MIETALTRMLNRLAALHHAELLEIGSLAAHMRSLRL